MDEVQREIKAYLKPKGFRVRGRNFNRTSDNGIVQVITLQMGRFDPPGTYRIPWFREKLHGFFTVNLGVFVPEVGRCSDLTATKSLIGDSDCCIRSRLCAIGSTKQDLWWKIHLKVVPEVIRRIERDAFPYFERHATRDAILNICAKPEGWLGRSRIIAAIIHAERGNLDKATRELSLQIQESSHEGHNKYIRTLFEKLGLPSWESEELPQ